MTFGYIHGLGQEFEKDCGSSPFRCSDKNLVFTRPPKSYIAMIWGH